MDSLQRFVFEAAPVRGEIVHLEATWRAVLDRHPYPPPLSALLGELMAAAALLSATIKFSGSMIMQLYGSRAVKLVVVECTSQGTMRATAKWEGEVPSGALADILGEGRFVITLDPQEPSTQAYQGIVALEGRSVAEVLENYMRRSEQLDTSIRLAVDRDHAAGMMLQRLPGESPDPDAWNRAVRLGATITSQELLGLAAPEIIRRLFHEEDIRLFDRTPVSFRCSCSPERVANMLRMLGREEVEAIIAEQGQVDVRCEFCNRGYAFDAVDAAQLFAAQIPLPASSKLH
ncbi:MAG: Hsp33 family molecular chaperone HslO [Betaproteobacteria bacterium]|nr:Hsp33 family molecular chaperone HslO [Betaproteobacteria bacterium]